MGQRGPSITTLRPVVNALTQMGLDWRSILSASGIDPELIDDCEARISAEAFAHFWPTAAEITGDACLGLHVGEHVSPASVNILGYLLISSPTVRAGLERVVRFQRLVFDAEWLTLIDEGSSTLIRFETDAIDPLDLGVQLEYKAALITKLLDWVTSARFHATEIRFRHAPRKDPSEYERILQCPVKFRCKESGLVYTRAGLEQPSMHANEEIARAHEEFAERHLAAFEDRSLARRVKTVQRRHGSHSIHVSKLSRLTGATNSSRGDGMLGSGVESTSRPSRQASKPT